MSTTSIPSTGTGREDPHFAGLQRQLAEGQADLRQAKASLERLTLDYGALRRRLDEVSAAVWDDVYERQRQDTDKLNLRNAMLLKGYSNRLLVIGTIVAVWTLGSVIAHTGAILIGLLAYAAFAGNTFLRFRAQSIGYVRTARKESIAAQGDLRLVAFSHVDHTQEFPLRGLDGPLENGTLGDRVWKLPGLDSNEVLAHAFLQVMDASGNVAMLTRLGARSNNTSVYWLQTNQLAKSYGGYLEKALTKCTPALAAFEEQFVHAAQLSHKVAMAEQQVALIQKALADYGRSRRIWDEVILPEDTKDAIFRRVHMFNTGDPAAPRGLLLYGPPGTGKTLLAKTIAKIADAKFIPLSLGDLKMGYLGQSAQRVKEIFQDARRARSIIFVDECEGVFGKRGSIESDAITNEIVQTFLAEWDGIAGAGSIWVVGATNRRDILDEAAVSRFGSAIEIGLPDAASRQKILLDVASRLRVAFPVDDEVVKATMGMSGRDLEQLVRNVKTETFGAAITTDVIVAAITKMRGRTSSNVGKDSTWDNLVLPSETKERLQTMAAMLQHAEAMKRQGIALPRGLLLYGPPGTGKTEVARTLANESGLQFIGATLADVKMGYLGQSGQKVKEIFERARQNSPSILFLDELDNLVPSSRGGDQLLNEISSQVLQEMDGIKAHEGHVFVVGATNYPDRIEPAILSRLVEHIEIRLPDAAARAEIIKRLLRGKPVEGAIETLAASIAESTEGLAGRDLRSIVDRATQKAVMRALKAGMPDKIVIAPSDFAGGT